MPFYRISRLQWTICRILIIPKHVNFCTYCIFLLQNCETGERVDYFCKVVPNGTVWQVLFFSLFANFGHLTHLEQFSKCRHIVHCSLNAIKRQFNSRV